MWFLKLIGFAVAFIIIRFIIDLIIQSKEMKDQGGARKKYSKIVDHVLSSHPDSKIFQQDNTSVVVGVQGIAGSQVFYITKAFEVVIIQMKVRNNPLWGNIEMEWKFPENMDQDLIITQINADQRLKLKQIISSFKDSHASYDKYDELGTEHSIATGNNAQSWCKERDGKNS